MVQTKFKIVYYKLLGVFRKLEQDHCAVLGMLEKCAISAIELYDKIGAENDLDKNRNNKNDNLTFSKVFEANHENGNNK